MRPIDSLTDVVGQLEELKQRLKESARSARLERQAERALSDSHVRRVVVLPDVHVEVMDKRAVRAVTRYIRDYRWDEWIQLGDLLDLDVVSKHNKDNLRAVEGGRLDRVYGQGEEFLDAQRDAVGDDCRMTLIEGNHCYRPKAFVDKYPHLEGLIEPELRLRLRERGINWVPFWTDGSLYNVGKAYFCHGQYTTKNHPEKMAREYGCPVFYGHTHDAQCAQVKLRGHDSMIVGQSLGCLIDFRVPYMRGAPSNWQHAFGVFYFLPGGNFTYYVPRIYQGRFVSPEGRVYDGK